MKIRLDLLVLNTSHPPHSEDKYSHSFSLNVFKLLLLTRAISSLRMFSQDTQMPLVA